MGPTVVEINHRNLVHNLNLIQKKVSPAKVLAVVKANAYGHGSIEVSRTLIRNEVDFLGVAFHDEGIELREAGIDTQILVFGAQLNDFLEEHVRYDLDITLTSEEQIQYLSEICSKLNKKARVHFKIDTGMNRVGFNLDHFIKHVDAWLNKKFLEVVGMYSHLSSSDEEDLSYTLLQLDRFQEVREKVMALYDGPVLFHLANSGAIMRLPETYFDYVRPGVMLYGNPPSPGFKWTWDLKEVMRYKSKVTLVKNVPKDEPISYNRRYYTKKDTKIAVVPAGYADGYNRALTNKGEVLIQGRRWQIAGTVCMDQIIIDIGPNSKIQVGDEVVLFGHQFDNHISILDVSEKLNTIPYEVTCWPSQRVPRTHYYNE
jgi:alanine racemase